MAASTIRSGDLLAKVAPHAREEEITVLGFSDAVRIERIVSTGQASPPGFWYDQEEAEWVFLIQGTAALLIEGEDAPRILRKGAYVEIPAHARHRVEWTDREEPTIWLAVHLRR